MLGPEMRVGAGVDQLRAHAHPTTGPLHTAFQNMCHTKLLPYLAKIALYPAPVLHHRRTANDLEVGDFCQIRQDFVGHTIGEEGVFLFVAQVLKGQNGDAFSENMRGNYLEA